MIKVGRREAYESYARAKLIDSGTPVALYQMPILDQDYYVTVIGHVGMVQSEEYLSEFATIAFSYRKR